MSERFSISSQWLQTDGDDAAETATMAEVAIYADELCLTQLIDRDRANAVSSPKLPTVGLAEGLVRRWWQILYEPQRTSDRDPRYNFEFRHRLDAFTAGYVFPPVGLWSGGDTVMVGMFKPDVRFHTQAIMLPDGGKKLPASIARGEVESSIGEFIAGTISKLGLATRRSAELNEDWEKIVTSTHDADEREWCTNAGRLGLDPYDPDTLDLNRMAAGISSSLFADICEAVDISELGPTCEWVRSATARLRQGPTIHVKGFGAPPYRDFTTPGWRNGVDAVEHLRARLSLPLDPRKALRQLFDDVSLAEGEDYFGFGATVLEGIARREGNEVKTTVPARSVRQRRFRTCRATYLGWRAGPDTEVAATQAETWRQQASRSFAAELLAPAKLIKDRYGKTGLNQVAIERLASEWLCPPKIIEHQAINNRIPVKGNVTSAVF